jgi:hypothetical protein
MRYLIAALIVSMLPVAGLGQASPPAGAGGMFGIDLGPGPAVDASAAAHDGISWARITADWSTIQPARDRFVWTDLDNALHETARAGLRTVVMLANTPKWAALDPQASEDIWKHQAPRDLSDWQRFVAAAAARYRGRVAAWQVEPALDLAVFRGTVPDYLAMLHAARLALRAGDPQAAIAAASPPGLDLVYIKTMWLRAPLDFDALMLTPRGRSAEDLLEALITARTRIPNDGRHQLWLADDGASWPAGATAAEAADQVAKMAAAAVSGGMAHVFWAGRAAEPSAGRARQTAVRMLDAAHLVGWLSRGPGVYVFIVTAPAGTFGVMWSTAGPRTVSVPADAPVRVLGAEGAARDTRQPSGGQAQVAVTASPVFVQGLGQAAAAEAAKTAQQGTFRVALDPAHDFSRADSVSVALGARNVERGLYNQRFRSIPSGAVVPVTVDGVEAVRTDVVKDAVYVYLDVDHSYAYFLDGRDDVLVTIEVHRAAVPEQVGFNLLYDSTTGYRFTPWQWIDAGSGWATYSVRLPDADFSSAWGWDLAINGAGDKKAPLIVRSVVVKRVPRAGYR